MRGVKGSRDACHMDDCDKPARGHGLCHNHWRRWRKFGDPFWVTPVEPAKPSAPWRTTPLDPEACVAVVASITWATRIAVNETTSCVEWTGGTDLRGYGRVWLAGRMAVSHRVAWVAANGVDIEQGMVIDHLCRNPPCVNAEHLEQVTSRENALRGEGLPAQRARMTHCINGHPLIPGNLVLDRLRKGSRRCLTCKRAEQRAARQRRATS